MSAQVDTRVSEKIKKVAVSSWKPLGTVAFFFVVWESLWLLTGGVGFSHSWEVISRIFSMLSEKTFWEASAWTVALTLGTLAIGATSAVLLGMLLKMNSTFEKSTEGMIFFVRGLPGVALIPLLMVSTGSRLGVVLWFSSLVVGFKMMVFVLRGLSRTEPLLLDQSRALGMSKKFEFFFLRLPSAFQEISLGVRLSVSRAYSAVLISGLLAGTPGFGEAIDIARLNADSDTLLAYVVISAFLGVAFFYLIAALLGRFVKWQQVT